MFILTLTPISAPLMAFTIKPFSSNQQAFLAGLLKKETLISGFLALPIIYGLTRVPGINELSSTNKILLGCASASAVILGTNKISDKISESLDNLPACMSSPVPSTSPALDKSSSPVKSRCPYRVGYYTGMGLVIASSMLIARGFQEKVDPEVLK